MATKKQKIKRKIRKSCERKKKYNSEKEAKVKCGFLNKKGIHVKPYKCPNCGGFHLCKRDPVTIVYEILDSLNKKE